MNRLNVRVEIVRTPRRLAEVAEAWGDLWARSGASVFQSHGWVNGWVATLPAGSRLKLRIALGWRGDQLVAALPLVITRRHGLRALEWACKEHTDYCDALLAPELDAMAVLPELWRAVWAAGGFDLGYLSHLEPGAAALSLSPDALLLGHRAETSLRLRSSWRSGGAWLASLSKKPRQNFRRGWKALEEFGPAVFRELKETSEIEAGLRRLAVLKREWLVRTGSRSTLLDDDAAPLTALVRAVEAAGRLRVFVLEVDGRIAAGAINFVEGRRMMAFFAAYDPTYDRASVGSLLMFEYIMRAFDEGIDEIDFLCGDEEYKRKFANARVRLVSTMAGRTLVGKAAMAFDAWRTRRRAREVGRAEAPLGERSLQTG